MSFTPSPEQQAIFDAALNTNKNIAVAALAGTGKTATLTELAKRLPKSGKKLFCAFNKSIVEELEERLKGTGMVAKTFHSMGYGALIKHFGGKQPKVDGGKYKAIVKAWLALPEETKWEQDTEAARDLALEVRELVTETVKVLPPEERGDRAAELQKEFLNLATGLLNFLRLKLVEWDDADALRDLVDHYNLEETLPFGFVDLAVKAVPYLMTVAEARIKEAQEIDFTDQIYWVVRWNLAITQYDWVFADEAQDLSQMQRAMVAKALKPNGRIVLVGDKHQCQPPETMVRMADGITEKRIDQLEIGDAVVTYDRRSALFVRSGVISQIASRHYEGDMYRICAGDKVSRSTNNHKWLVRWSNKAENVWITYLMRQGNRYRIGQTRLFRKIGEHLEFGLAARARVERADAAWILKVHHNLGEALGYEEIVSTRYGLPQIVFHEPSGIQHFTSDVIDWVYEQIGDRSENALRCLRDHGRMAEYPIWSKDEWQRQGRNTLFETQACNLISGYMAIPVPSTAIRTEERLPVWATIEVTTEHYSGLVYSLNVERHHKYVADGLLTCNSIYEFAGADSDSFDLSVKQFNAQVLRLTMTRRCAKVVVHHAARLVPEFQCPPDKARGQFVWLMQERVVGILEKSDMVLCRMKAPLISLCLNLIAANKPATILGTEIGKALIAILEKLTTRKDYEGFDKIDETLDAYEAELVEHYISRDEPQLAEAIEDQCSAIRTLIDRAAATSLAELSAFIERLFSGDSNKDVILLTTVHKAKGLEAERVFILAPDRLPLNYPNMRPESAQQEMNLLYVAVTRAKQTLVIVTTEKYRKDRVMPSYGQTDFEDHPWPANEFEPEDPNEVVAELEYVYNSKHDDFELVPVVSPAGESPTIDELVQMIKDSGVEGWDLELSPGFEDNGPSQWVLAYDDPEFADDIVLGSDLTIAKKRLEAELKTLAVKLPMPPAPVTPPPQPVVIAPVPEKVDKLRAVVATLTDAELEDMIRYLSLFRDERRKASA